MWRPSLKGCGVNKPVDTWTLSAADGEALIARVHRSDLPRAAAETVEWVIRMYFHVVFALQEAHISMRRLRSLLFGKPPAPFAETSGARAVREADAEADATAKPASPVESPPPEQAKATGGHRLGTGRLG